MRYFPRGFAVAAAMALVSTAGVSLADTKEDCAKAYEASQEQRGAGKLRAARESLVTCSQSACPAFIKKDCTKWLSEVESAMPTVVFSAKAGSKDLTDVTVTLGDQVLADSLNGKAIPMDPGTHSFVFESAKHGSKELKFVVKEGKKAQNIEVVFDAPKDDGGAAGAGEGGDTTGDTGGTKVTTEDLKGSSAAAYVLMGVGVVGLGGFAYFGLSGKSEENGLACAEFKTCTDDDLDPVKKKYLYADISLGVGIVSLGVGTYLLLSSGGKRETPPAQSARRLRFDVAPGRGGGYATLAGSF